MTIEEIKNALRRKAVIFETGGFRPTNELGESWIGAVKWKKVEDTLPKDKDGNEMLPLATIFTENLGVLPKEIENVKLINVYISENVYDHLMDLDGYFMVQVYDSLEGLEPCAWLNGQIKAFPLKAKEIVDDFPEWDGGMDPKMEDEIIKHEDEEDIDYYEDIHTEVYSMHKVGGYPAYIQSGNWDKRYEFIFQISSDEKARFNIVDSGSFYFFYSKELDNWEMQCDFF